MKKIIKDFFKIKFFFKKPKKVDVLIFDKTNYQTLRNVLNFNAIKIDYCAIRFEELNLYVLFKIFLRGNFTNQSYIDEYIKITSPKIVLTFIDNNLSFYQLKKKFPKIKFISIQNGYRFPNDSMLSTLIKKKFNKNHYSCDYYLVFNEQTKKIMEKYISTNFIIAGSLKNNRVKKEKFYYKEVKKIGFISRFDLLFTKSLDQIKKNRAKYILYNFVSKLLKNLSTYCRKNNLELVILTRSFSIDNEKKYYKKIIGDIKHSFLVKENELSSYENLYKADIWVSPSSTIGSEALSRELKVLSFSEDKIIGSNFGWPFLKTLNGPFFSNDIEYKNIQFMLKNISHLPYKEWKKILDEYSNYTCVFDNDNQILKDLIKKLLN